MSADDPMTDAQRNAVHVWMREVAKVFNENGIDKRVVLHNLSTRGIDTQWTMESFKADVYKPIYAAVCAKQSTEEANRTDHDYVIQGITKWVGQTFGVVLPPFPSKDGL